MTVAVFCHNSLFQSRSESVLEICRLTLIPVLGIVGNPLSEFSSMCSECTIVVTGVSHFFPVIDIDVSEKSAASLYTGSVMHTNENFILKCSLVLKAHREL